MKRVIIRLPEVKRRTARSRSEIYRAMHAGTFPRAVKLGSRSVGWVEDEIDEYVDKVAADKRTGTERR
jgi:prophage regulatory protein